MFQFFLLNSSIPSDHWSYSIFRNTQVLILKRNSIKQACLLHSLTNYVVHLDLGFNLITVIQKRCFSSSIFLKSLSLKKNQISYLEVESFFDLHVLKFLDLSHNPIIILPSFSFRKLFSLLLLNLSAIPHKEVSMNIFDDIRLGVIILNTNYYISCIVSHYSIYVLYPPWFVSCSGILPTKYLKIFFIFISLLICSFNIISPVIQIFTSRSNQAFQITAVAVNLNDLLCGFYLCIIWVSDISLQNSLYISDSWTSDSLCFFAFGIILWFTILSQLLLIFLSSSRLWIVLQPLNNKIKRVKFTLRCILVMYGFSFCIALFVMLLFKFTFNSLPTGFCLPFIDPTNSIIITKYITWSVVLTQTLTSITTIMIYYLLFIELQRSKNTITATKSYSVLQLSIQLVLITVSNILCWFPANAIYISAMFLPSYPIDLIIWTITVVLPINSIVNPLVIIVGAMKNLTVSSKT